MAKATCSIEGCVKPVRGRGWCGMHYARWERNGDPLAFATNQTETPPIERILALVVVDSESGCWEWPSRTDRDGYARVAIPGGSSVAAHRVVYAEVVGPIADGLTVDHHCHNLDLSCPGGAGCAHRRCLNPNHLRVVDRRTNTLAGRSPAAVNAAKTHCIHGHEFTPENTYRWSSNGLRVCRTCNRAAAAASKARRQVPRV